MHQRAVSRRLIEERRITFVRIGRKVRIPESALNDFIAAGLVHPITTRAWRAAWVSVDSGAFGNSLRDDSRPGIRA
ncbi:excisionase family DNA-binding protein [Nonomuraea polychroma]|uniref:excisionase family DNA-binding protein n=1 Tax=Nonomuraea polychroma TaxID=46176 RepID=UPI003D8FC590